MNKKKSWALILLAFFLCSIIVFKPFSFPKTKTGTEIYKSIFTALEEEAFVPVIVVLKDRANLQENIFNGKDESIPAEVIVNKLQQTARASEQEIWPVLKEEITKGNINDYRPFWIVNAFTAQINAAALKRLSALPQVIHIRPERQYTLSTPLNYIPVENRNDTQYTPAAYQAGTGESPWNLELIKAPLVWQQGIYGKEIVVAIMDTGVDLNHPVLNERYRGNLQGHSHETSWYDAAAASGGQVNSGPRDLNGHGTHIAGVILGGSPQEPFGVAPGARWIAVNIFNKGYAWDSHIIQAFQWLMAPEGNPKNAPRIINCSWASRPEYVRDYLQWEILHNLERAGIFVVFAAGNNGTSGPGSPASYPHAFSVGAVQKEGETIKIADFSSRGPVNWQGIIYAKPEISAPGIKIRSSWLNNGYTILDGTSLAAAHVSGTAALLLESKPELSPAEIKYILQQAAYWDPSWNVLGERPNNAYGFGILDAYEALRKRTLPSREILLDDGAEEGIVNWSTSPGNPWKITREKVYQGNFAFADSPWEQYKNNSRSWLSITKPLSLCGYHSPVLSFWHFYDLSTGKNKEDDYGYVEFSTDGKNWAYLYRFSGTNEQFRYFSLPLNLPKGINTFYIRFRLESNNNGPGRGWYLDNISISAVPLSLTDLERLILNSVKTKIGVEESTEINAAAIFCSRLSRELTVELLEWNSSDPSVATVQNGKVKGISPGEAIISGQFAGHTAEIKIEVIEVKAPDVQPVPGTFINSVTFELVPATPGARIYYTLDGSEPDEKSIPYERPVTITESKVLKAREYFMGIPGPSSVFSYTINEGAVVTGSITLQGRSLTDSKTSVFFICDKEGQIYTPPSLSPEGKYSLELPLGSYKLVAKREQYLAKTAKVELKTKKELQELNLKLWAGDLNNDNRIDITDLTLLSLAYRSKPGDKHWNPLADLNSDGVIDIFDLTMLTQNFGMGGDN